MVLADDSNATSTSSASSNSKIESTSSGEQEGTAQINNTHLNQSLETGSWDGNDWELTDDGLLNFNNGIILEQPTQNRGMTAEQESKIKKINVLDTWSLIRDYAGRNLFANFPNL
ncbi:hypothetical protein ACJQWY_05635 [Weissella kandleri]|uniref:hypothetical protein n=1 Tax=Weissella kandleri TaxID=1616 RepID=UPI00387EA22D